jgi:hypothetical protein
VSAEVKNMRTRLMQLCRHLLGALLGSNQTGGGKGRVEEVKRSSTERASEREGIRKDRGERNLDKEKGRGRL